RRNRDTVCLALLYNLPATLLRLLRQPGLPTCHLDSAMPGHYVSQGRSEYFVRTGSPSNRHVSPSHTHVALRRSHGKSRWHSARWRRRVDLIFLHARPSCRRTISRFVSRLESEAGIYRYPLAELPRLEFSCLSRPTFFPLPCLRIPSPAFYPSPYRRN